MTAAFRLRATADQTLDRACGRPAAMARIEVLHDFAAAEAVWRRLERDGATVTPYERFDYLSLWQQQIGAPAGITPAIVVGFDALGAPAFLWPLGFHRAGPLRILTCLGGRQANFRFGLWRRDVVATFGAADVTRALAEVGKAHAIDLVVLPGQQPHWDGMANPFALLRHQLSPDANHCAALGQAGAKPPQPSRAMRRQLRSKERRLQQLAGYRYVRATTSEDVDRFLQSFFALKAAHLAVQGVRNVFADPNVERFLTTACHTGLADGHPLIELHAIEAEGEMLALLAGPSDGRRLSCLFNTYTLGAHARQSPGLVLLPHVLADLTARGFDTFDLGIGEARYKAVFCKDTEPLFDCFLPLTLRGRPAALAARAVAAAKRRIKQMPALRAGAHRVRRTLFGHQLSQ
jgi:CelD/BcsL family acetyltransferase involved in cellulose biosynthesis